MGDARAGRAALSRPKARASAVAATSPIRATFSRRLAVGVVTTPADVAGAARDLATQTRLEDRACAPRAASDAPSVGAATLTPEVRLAPRPWGQVADTRGLSLASASRG